MKKGTILWIVLGIILALVLGYIIVKSFESKEDNTENNSQIANPASVYCVDHGGKLEIREDNESNQYGVCVFNNGSECEEWAYLRNKCSESNTS